MYIARGWFSEHLNRGITACKNLTYCRAYHGDRDALSSCLLFASDLSVHGSKCQLIFHNIKRKRLVFIMWTKVHISSNFTWL